MTEARSPDRAAHLARLGREEFDVVVVGGGVTGAGAARDAARRGYRTALVEARDFGAGTSSRSSRLVHGGLRYLEQLEFDLVFEGSRERRALLRIAPHMVRPLEFLFPLYEEGRVGKRKLDAGMWLYDALALFRNIERHQMLEPDEVLEREPGLRREGLLGGARYFDAQVDDARLVLVNVLDAAEAGAAVANRAEAVAFGRREGRIASVEVRTGEGRELSVAGRVFLNATGPWTDRVLERAGNGAGNGGGSVVRPTRGSHVHVEREHLDHESALIFESPLDSRIMFVLPWGDLAIVGTTDEDYEGDPADVVPTAGDVAYLLESANRLFPEARLSPDHVVGAWAGLRPLVREEGVEEEAVSRDYVISAGPPGLLTIAGGKLTSYRKMAEDLVDRAGKLLEEEHGVEAERGCDTREAPLPGGDFEELDAFRERLEAEAAPHRLPASSVDRLAGAYGTRASEVLSLLQGRPALREPLAPDRPYLSAEVLHAARREMALHLEDVLYRRTRAALEVPSSELEPLLERASRIMADGLGWSEAEREEEMERVRALRAGDEAFREELGARWPAGSGEGRA